MPRLCRRACPRIRPASPTCPLNRWLAEARQHYRETPEGLRITYDPALREAFLAAFDGPPVDLWPLFDAWPGCRWR